MKTVYVTIGRNVKGKPMAKSMWDLFQHKTQRTLFAHGNIVTDAEGVGVWDGKTEDCHIYVVTGVDTPIGLRMGLSYLAQEFQQDSIAYAEAEVEFLG